MIIEGNALRCRIAIALSRVPQVLAIGIVERGDLSLDVTVLLQRIGILVLGWWEHRDLGHPGGEPASEVGSNPGVPGIQRHLGLQAHKLVASVEDLEGLELSDVTQVRVPGGVCNSLTGSHGTEHL